VNCYRKKSSGRVRKSYTSGRKGNEGLKKIEWKSSVEKVEIAFSLGAFTKGEIYRSVDH
jgi:hypothetical protein